MSPPGWVIIPHLLHTLLSLFLCLSVLHMSQTVFSFDPSFLSLYLTYTSMKSEWNVIRLQIGSRTSKSFYKYSDSPDDHKINLQNHTQHCSANSNPSRFLSAEENLFLSSFYFPSHCCSHCVSVCWGGKQASKRPQRARETDNETHWDRECRSKPCTMWFGNTVLNYCHANKPNRKIWKREMLHVCVFYWALLQ